MNRRLLQTIVALLLAGAAVYTVVDYALRPPPVGIKVGYRAPDFELGSLDGQTVRLSDLRGKPVFLNFWATWCIPCEVEMPEIQKTYASWEGKAHIIGMNAVESVDKVRAYLAERHLTFPVLLADLDTLTEYQVTSIPMSIFLDPDGVITEIVVGPMSAKQMEAALEKSR